MKRVVKLTVFLIIAMTVFTFLVFELVNVINWLFTGEWRTLNHIIKGCLPQFFLVIILSPIIAIYDCYIKYKSNK
jgi:hypothetical protein